MNKPHKHCEVIKAWADGAKIQFLDGSKWEDCSVLGPQWILNYQYRVKPEPLVRYFTLCAVNGSSARCVGDNLALTFADDGKLINAEVLK